MPGFNPQPSRRRRWLFTAAILIVGGAIALWASARETKRLRSVEDQVQAICRDFADNVDLTGRLNKSNPSIERRVLEEMRRVLGARDDADLVAVRVVSGDSMVDRSGSRAAPATHTAILHLADIDLLALRVRCDAPDEPIIVLGYVMPPQQAK